MTRYSQNCRGFTLVELLVVITIIGVLASLAAGGAWYAMVVVRNGMTKAQLSQMDLALEAYKGEFNEYPPMLNDEKAVMRHVNSRWKRANLTYADILNAAKVSGSDDFVLTNTQMVAASLTFWLGGRYDSSKESFVGFSADLENPLKLGGQRTEPLFDFSKNVREVRDEDADESTKFAVVLSFAIDNKPVVYFRSTATGDYDPAFCFCGWTDFDDAVPYMKSATVWHGAKKYQLIHPGRDGNFGKGFGTRIANASETGLTYEDYDNIVNFTETSTLQGALNQ